MQLCNLSEICNCWNVVGVLSTYKSFLSTWVLTLLLLPFYFLIVRRVPTNNSANFAIRNFIQMISARSLWAAKVVIPLYHCLYASTSATFATYILARCFRACSLVRFSSSMDTCIRTLCCHRVTQFISWKKSAPLGYTREKTRLVNWNHPKHIWNRVIKVLAKYESSRNNT